MAETVTTLEAGTAAIWVETGAALAAIVGILVAIAAISEGIGVTLVETVATSVVVIGAIWGTAAVLVVGTAVTSAEASAAGTPPGNTIHNIEAARLTGTVPLQTGLAVRHVESLSPIAKPAPGNS